MGSKRSSKIKVSLILLGFAALTIATFAFQGTQQEPAASAPQAGNVQAPVVVAYQTGVDPSKVAQAEGRYEAATGTQITWRKFDSGADVIAAVASGDVPIGNIGSSPFAAAASRNLPIEAFFIASVLGQSEALVTRPNIKTPQDLIGKKIAVPFVSTTHYSLLSALKHWNIDAKQVNIINLRPPEITGAWERGDIDGAYVWEPVLSGLKNGGQVLTSSEEVGTWGAPTYDIWIVRKDFAKQHPEFLRRFAEVTADAGGQYRADPKAFAANETNLKAIAGLTGSKTSDIANLLAGNRYPDLAGQKALLEGSFASDIKKTAEFLRDQGKIDSVNDSYAGFVNADFVQPKGQ